MKEIKINIPQGYEIDYENSTYECIKFKRLSKWRDNTDDRSVSGYYIESNSVISSIFASYNSSDNYNVFATEKQAKSALAMARISQIMTHDERFGGAITDEEWNDGSTCKHCITRTSDSFHYNQVFIHHYFLAFHTKEQRDLFLKENEDLCKDYLML